MKNNKAFTLIELLVVIAIIAILAAILFPVFAKAREKARQTTCASNLKQLSLGVIQYTEDYDECWPGLPSVSGSFTWDSLIYPYVKADKVYECPDDPNHQTNAISYAINGNLGWNGHAVNTSDTKITGAFVNISKLNTPVRTVLFVEVGNQTLYGVVGGKTYYVPEYDQAGPNATGPDSSGTGRGGIQGYYETGLMGNPANDPTNANVSYAVNGNTQMGGLHSGGSNYAFCDGHVKWLIGTSISPGITNSDPICPQEKVSAWGGSCNQGSNSTAGRNG